MIRPDRLRPLLRGLPVAVIAGAAGLILGGQPETGTAHAAPVDVSNAPYSLKCWQEGVQIFSVREDKALRGLEIGSGASATFENQDGSRRLMLPLGGTTFCMADFAAR